MSHTSILQTSNFLKIVISRPGAGEQRSRRNPRPRMPSDRRAERIGLGKEPSAFTKAASVLSRALTLNESHDAVVRLVSKIGVNTAENGPRRGLQKPHHLETGKSVFRFSFIS